MRVGWQIPNCNGKCKDFQDLLIVFALQVSLESKTTQKKMSKLRDVSLPTKGHGNRLTSTSFLSVASSSNFCHNFTHARLEFQTLESKKFQFRYFCKLRNSATFFTPEKTVLHDEENLLERVMTTDCDSIQNNCLNGFRDGYTY